MNGHRAVAERRARAARRSSRSSSSFLYAPILILLVFSFNDSDVPSFPLSGFTLHWYRQFIAQRRSARVAGDERDHRRR